MPQTPLSDRARADELGDTTEHAQVRLTVTSPDPREIVENSGVEHVVGIDEDWVDPGHAWGAPGDARPTDVLGVLYTSGWMRLTSPWSAGPPMPLRSAMVMAPAVRA